MESDEFERCERAFLREFQTCQPALWTLGDETCQCGAPRAIMGQAELMIKLCKQRKERQWQ